MTTLKKRSPLWWAMLCCGLICTVLLLWQRGTAEAADRHVAAAISYDDLKELGAADGRSSYAWMRDLSKAGLQYVIYREDISDETLSILNYDDLAPACAGTLCLDQPAFFLPDAGQTLPDTAAPVALTENLTRTSMEVPAGLNLEQYSGDLVKTLYLYDSYANRYTDADGGQEIENLLFRAATDRGMRLLILTPFTDAEGTLIDDVSVYTHVLSGLASRLEARGLTFGQGFSAMDARATQPALLCGVSFFPAALLILLLAQLPVSKKLEPVLCILAIPVLVAAFLLRPELAQKGTMLLTAVLFPCGTAIFLYYCSRKPRCGLLQLPLALCYPLTVLLVLVWSLLGGLMVSALLASRPYLMGVTIFSGVKVAELLPLAVCLLLLAYASLRDLQKGHANFRVWIWCGLALAVVAAGGYLLLRRSGDLSGGISGVETTLRNGLEYYLYARPRTKEFLIAVPAMAVFVWSCTRRTPLLRLLSGTAACIESISVVNTFCHGVAPMLVSVTRSALAAGIGLALGLLALALLALIPKRRV